ncbi:hypothetical protein [Cohnella boryungensis]|uniref:Uncharacterized protein n=1 Tax=Cohnella boryungensis TaxID=768479 RepID=A0ABV8S9K2_9BACL
MIPLRNTLPYDVQMKDVTVPECPFCQSPNVLLPITPEEVIGLYGGASKKTLVFPCCRGTLRIIDADRDYLLAARAIR